MPYDMPMGNFESRAIVSTSRLLTAVLNVCQKVSADSAPVSSRSKEKVVKVFIVIQSGLILKRKVNFGDAQKVRDCVGLSVGGFCFFGLCEEKWSCNGGGFKRARGRS